RKSLLPRHFQGASPTGCARWKLAPRARGFGTSLGGFAPGARGLESAAAAKEGLLPALRRVGTRFALKPGAHIFPGAYPFYEDRCPWPPRPNRFWLSPRPT